MNGAHRTRTAILAIVGILLAGGLGAISSALTNRPVGIEGESPLAGRELVASTANAPDPAQAGRRGRGKGGRGTAGHSRSPRPSALLTPPSGGGQVGPLGESESSESGESGPEDD